MEPSENTPLIQNQNGCCARASSCLKTSLVYLFTDWPWEIAQYAVMPNTIPKDSKTPKGEAEEGDFRCSIEWLLLWPAIILFRLSFIIIAVVTQLMTCFRRDRISTNFTMVLIHNTSLKKLTCNEKSEVISSLLIPDMVIVLLAFWVYFGLKFGSQYCRGCFGWKELNSVMKADTTGSLNTLVIAARPKLIEKAVTVIYTVIPFVYIILSQVVSIVYLEAFKLANEDVIIQAPLGGPTLGKDLKYGMITLSFVGFIALDVLYLQVIMRYAYRCQMIIYYLQIIKQKVNEFKTVTETNEQRIKDQEMRDHQEIQLDEGFENQKLKDHQKSIMEQTETAYTFIKQLNASSGTIALVIIIAAFQAANCAVILLCNEITYPQAVAVALRLILWAFLAVFPFHKAAGVNITSKRLRDLGWDMHRPSLACHYDPHGLNNGVHVSLKARVFGISVNPWLPYLVTILLLLTIMVGSKFKWYEHVL